MVMTGARPLEGLCHGHETDLKVSSHAVQLLMPLLTIVATMAGYGNEHNQDLELDTLAKVGKYRQAIHDVLVSDTMVMKGFATLVEPKDKEDESLDRELSATGSGDSSRGPSGPVHPYAHLSIEEQYQALVASRNDIIKR